jgi:signal transduction histidine kinase
MSDIIWNINPAHDSIDDVVSRMREYATTILEANQIEYHFYFPQEEIKQQVSMAIKNSLYLIFKEAVNNLVKYSGATTVSLYLLMEDGHNRLVIEDNGKGFDKSTLKHLGGLNNMEFRANEIKGTLHITSVLNKGTKVELIFPHFN